MRSLSTTAFDTTFPAASCGSWHFSSTAIRRSGLRARRFSSSCAASKSSPSAFVLVSFSIGQAADGSCLAAFRFAPARSVRTRQAAFSVSFCRSSSRTSFSPPASFLIPSRSRHKLAGSPSLYPLRRPPSSPPPSRPPDSASQLLVSASLERIRTESSPLSLRSSK